MDDGRSSLIIRIISFFATFGQSTVGVQSLPLLVVYRRFFSLGLATAGTATACLAKWGTFGSKKLVCGGSFRSSSTTEVSSFSSSSSSLAASLSSIATTVVETDATAVAGPVGRAVDGKDGPSVETDAAVVAVEASDVTATAVGVVSGMAFGGM